MREKPTNYKYNNNNNNITNHNCCIFWLFTHIFTGIFIFKGLAAWRLYKLFGVKGLTSMFPYKIAMLPAKRFILQSPVTPINRVYIYTVWQSQVLLLNFLLQFPNVMKVKNQLDATKYAVLLPQHVSGTNMPIIRSTSEAIKLHTLSHLVGSLPSLCLRCTVTWTSNVLM
jgi:hypothetical protein